MAFPILGTPRPQFSDSTGVLASGTLSILNPVDDSNATYYPTADDADAGTNGQSGDIILNANGMTPDGLFGTNTGVYKVVLKDAAGSTIFTEDDIQMPGDAADITYNQGGTGAVDRTQEEKNQDIVSVKDFGAVWDNATDDLSAIQAAIDYMADNGGGWVTLPRGVGLVSDEIVMKDGVGLIGEGALWKRRTGYPNLNSVIKYSGAGGSNTCVVRASEKAVGTEGTDFSTPGTDDLLNCTLRDFHIDANGADFGLYAYRCGNSSGSGNVTAEGAAVANMIFLGMFAAHWGEFGSYESEDIGVIVGADQFSWGGSEFRCFDFHAGFHVCNNGTSNTYVSGSGTDLDNMGIKAYGGRGCHYQITSEANYGRAGLIGGYTSGGPVLFDLRYIEGNGDGFRVDYRTSFTAMRIRNGFIHPGNGGSLASQDFSLVARTDAGTTTANEGPSNPNEWLIFENLHGESSGVGVDIDSNTYKYRVRDCSNGITFSNSPPTGEGYIGGVYFKADSTLSDTRHENGMTVARSSAGRYTVTFDRAQPDTEYTVSIAYLNSAPDTYPILNTKSTTAFVVDTYDTADFSTRADPDGFLDIGVSRMATFNINS